MAVLHKVFVSGGNVRICRKSDAVNVSGGLIELWNKTSLGHI